MNELEDDVREDEFLAVRCQLGEAAATDELVERWHEPLWSYLHRMTGNDDDAAELVQETWLRVLRGLPRLRDPARLRPWLFGIARRVFMDRLRTRYGSNVWAQMAQGTDSDLTDEAFSVDTSGLDQEIEALHGELGELPVTERETLTLFYLRELSLAEVAQVQAVPIGTVKSRLHRARGMLRDRLHDRGYP
ncbi:sigma-70 family RNA polymerase sigma factor [soil metagenome]